MIMHSKLRRRHTWPFELFEFLCDEETTEVQIPGDNHPIENNSVTANTRDNSTCINDDRDHVSGNPCYHQHQHETQHLEEYEELNDTSHHHLLLVKATGDSGCLNSTSNGKNGPDVCTCKSSNNKIGLLDATTVLCASVLANSNNIITTTSSSSSRDKTLIAEGGGNRDTFVDDGRNRQAFTIGEKTDNCNDPKLGKQEKKTPAGSSGFQPIQDKFSFLKKKSRDSRKRKQKEKDLSKSTSSASSSTVVIQHKDYCPHAKLQEVKSISPTRKSDSSNASVFANKNSSDRDACFTSTSSNNNSPSHSQHSSSHHSHSVSVSVSQCPSSQVPSVNNKSSGIKGSVTCANIINCNSHHETEGKIPCANGTATGALSLQVNANTANGEIKKRITLWQNYYPEGQWGYIVVFCALIIQAINHGIQLGFSAFLVSVDRRFHVGEPALLGLLGSTSVGISLFFSPVWVSFCKTKSTRLTGVFGGLVASLGCLFTSFASQFHQLFFSYGAFIGIGVGLSRDASSLMVGQYFKRKREMVEIIVVAGSGLGISFMSVSIHTAITSIGWRLGLQAVTGAVLLTFFLGTCYRSASLYHPQRRAILHLKNQKKKVKVKDISKREEKPPFLDLSCLKSKTLQILLLSSAFTAFGINSPLFYLSLECGEARLEEISYVLLHIYVGAAWVVGCCLFGLIAVQKNQECRVSKQYLCQVASVICGISIIALTAVKGYSGLVVFSWVYGFSLGGYNYALKVYTYERVRARHFARAWSYVQCSQAIPIFVGTPLIGYMNVYFGRKTGYYISALAVFIGSACLFLSDVRRRRLSRRKANSSSMKTCSTSDATQSPKMRRLSFAFPVEPMSPHNLSKHDSGDCQDIDPGLLSKELTCISEEGLQEIDFQDIYFEDWAEYLGGDCITSCNKVENCIASEYDPDFSLLLDRRARRWSRNSIPFPGMGTVPGGIANLSSHTNLLPNTQESNFGDVHMLRVPPPVIREIPVFRNHPWGARPPPGQRAITVIDEASV